MRGLNDNVSPKLGLGSNCLFLRWYERVLYRTNQRRPSSPLFPHSLYFWYYSFQGGTWAHPCLPHNAMGTLALFVLLFLGGDNFWEVENNWIHIGPPREKD